MLVCFHIKILNNAVMPLSLAALTVLNKLVGLVWFIRVYPQGPGKGTLSNKAHIVPPTHF